MLKQILKAMRVKHWLKNALVFLPLIFSGQLTNVPLLLICVVSFFSFSFMASAIYLVNDIRDKDADAQHPPEVQPPHCVGGGEHPLAIALAAILVIASCALCAFFAIDMLLSLAIVVFYGLLNLGYSLKWKNIPVIDVTILSLGFLLRVLYGGYFCGVAVSQWLCLSILAMSFFFALGKRRGELKRYGSSMRASLESYTLAFFDNGMYVFMSAGIVFYSLWLFERMGGVDPMLMPIMLSLCVFIAVVACLRYCLDIEAETSDGDPVEVVFSDKVLLVTMVVWLAAMIALLYFIV